MVETWPFLAASASRLTGAAQPPAVQPYLKTPLAADGVSSVRVVDGVDRGGGTPRN